MCLSLGPVRSLIGVVGLSVLLSACGGGGGGDAAPSGSDQPRPAGSTTIEGRVIKGPVSNAVVRVYALGADGTPASEPLAQGITNEQGAFTLGFTDPAVAHVVVVATGGAYVDEVSGEQVAFAEADSMEAVSLLQSSGNHTVNVTPLTTLAAAKAKWVKANTEKTLTDAIVFGNLQVSALFGIENVVTAAIPGLDALNAAPQEQQTYALLLAGFSQMDADAVDRTAAQLIAAMANDFRVDGQIGNDPNSPNFENLVAAVEQFVTAQGGAITAHLPVAVRDRLNSSPVAGADFLETDEETPVSFFPLTNDGDPNSERIELFSVESQSAHGGSVSRNADGSVTYTPAKDFAGTDQFSYTILDASLNSGIGSVTINVRNVNDAPVAGAPVYDAAEGVALVSILLATDVDGDELVYSFPGQGSLGTVTLLNARTGEFRYEPHANASGVDSIAFAVSDGTLASTGQLQINVAAIDTAPVALSAHFTLDEDTVLAGQLPAREDDGDALAFTIVGQPTKGVLSLTNAATGEFTYVPAANANGQDSFSFQVRDVGSTSPADSNVATAIISINAINDAPSARPDSLGSVAEDTSFNFTLATLLVNDVDVDGDNLTVTALTLTQGDGNLVVANGSATFTPTPNYFGPVAFEYTVSDSTSTSVSTASLTVLAVEDAPVIVSGPVMTAHDGQTYTYAVIATDGDSVDVLQYSLSAATAGMTINTASGAISWLPSNADVGTHAVTVVVADPQGNTATQNFQLAVTNVNDAPIIISTPAATKLSAGNLFTYQVVATDADAGDAVTYSMDAYPLGMAMDPAGLVTWTPTADVWGSRRVVVRVTDSAGAFVTQEFYLTVVIPRNQWNVTFVDSEETVAFDQRIDNAFDGNPDTIWHTQWYQQQPTMPHQFEIDLGATYMISGFLSLPQQLCCNGRISHQELSLSMDGVTWNSVNVSKIDPSSAEEKTTLINLLRVQPARYVRYVALEAYDSRPYAAIAEFNLLGVATSDTPATNQITLPEIHVVTINAGETVSFAGTAFDADLGAAPATTWTFGGAGVANIGGLTPGAVQFNTPGTFTVSFSAVGALVPDTRIVRVLGGGETLVPKADWAVVDVSSEEWATYVNRNSGATEVLLDSVAEYAFDDDARTVWHTRWFYTTSDGFPHTLTIDLADSYALTGMRHLPRQDTVPRSIKNFSIEVSLDGSTWSTAIANGTLPNSTAEAKVLFDGGQTLDARYVRFTALTPMRSNFFAAVAELNLIGALAGP